MKRLSAFVLPDIALMKSTSALMKIMSCLMEWMRRLMEFTSSLMDFMNALVAFMSGISARMRQLMKLHIALVRADILLFLQKGASSLSAGTWQEEAKAPPSFPPLGTAGASRVGGAGISV